jgi:hypothetical protein
MNIRHKEITFHPGIHLRLHPLFPSSDVADEVGVLLPVAPATPGLGRPTESRARRPRHVSSRLLHMRRPPHVTLEMDAG